MTCRAARHHLLASYLIVNLEFIPIFLVNIAWLIIVIKYLGLWPNELLRSTVTRDAPFHLKCVFLEYNGHVVDRTMARRTADALGDVNTMVKIRVFGQIVDLFPLDRLIVAETCTDRLKVWAVGPDLTVAIHTGLRRRHTCSGRCFNCLVTIAAINAVVADVVFMAELDRLLLLQITSGQI